MGNVAALPLSSAVLPCSPHLGSHSHCFTLQSASWFSLTLYYPAARILVLTHIVLPCRAPDGRLGRGGMVLELRKLRLLDFQAKLRAAVEKEQDEINKLPDKVCECCEMLGPFTLHFAQVSKAQFYTIITVPPRPWSCPCISCPCICLYSLRTPVPCGLGVQALPTGQQAHETGAAALRPEAQG